MPVQRNMVLVISSAGMMLSALYACASFIFTCLNLRPVALSSMTITLIIAALTRANTANGWRRIYAIGFHLTAFLLVFLYLCHHYYMIHIPYWSIQWVPDFFLLERTAADWMLLFSITLCTCMLWFCGMGLITQPTDQSTISNRFDAGLGSLLFILLVKLAMASKGATPPDTYSATRFIIAFFILGLFSMGIARNYDMHKKGNISHLKGAGIALTFTVTLLLLGGGLFLLFLPEFQTFAETGAGLLKTISRPVEPLIIAALRLFFGRASWDSAPEGAGSAGSATVPQASAGDGAIAVIAPILGIILVFTVLLFCGIVLYRLFNWLFSKAPADTKKEGLWHFLLSVVQAARQLFLYIRKYLRGEENWPSQAEKYYRRLLVWGRYSGLGQTHSETPKEYASRLGCHFPNVANEIWMIVHLHDEVIYGCESLNRHQTAGAKIALRKLRTPLLWITRLRTLYFHNRP